ncbi:carbohydrate kinase family protein [Candidatus Woesebacteria bacterium]|nr:carbohydrate kinase family protein [Candidatus Woesebacteria bacterium]
MLNKYSKLILTGSICLDRIMNFNGRYKDLIQADKLHVLSLSILINDLSHSRGGTAANIAYSSALLGDQPILLGSVGHDAKQYIADLAEKGVDTSRVFYSELPTPTFTVLTDSDNNQVGGFYPGAMSDIQSLTLEPWYSQHPLVMISANDPSAMDQLVKECIAHNLDYVYDVSQQVTNITVDQMKLGLSKAKILFVNDYELGCVISRTGYSEDQLNAMIPVIVTTLGAEGTKITGSSVKNPLTIPALKHIKPVDPTGAGDAYRAGFLHGYLRDWSLEQCAQLGSTVATYTITRRGTQTHTFTLADVIKKHYSAYGRKL